MEQAGIDMEDAYGKGFMRRDRPFDGQSHTAFGDRGRTTIHGINFRDLCDCFVRACFLSAGHVDWKGYTEAELGELADLRPKDLHRLPFDKLSPESIMQNLSCEVERAMGIFPNLPIQQKALEE